MPQIPSSIQQAIPLASHLSLTIITVFAALCLIDPMDANRVYYLNQRRPHFTDLNGSPRLVSIQSAKLLQSDVTTTLSLLASATRAAAAWWAGKLLWRCTFMFMEKSEITLAGFSKVMSGGITTLLSPHHVSSRKNWLLIYAIIFICFGMDYFSAFLTGSVTWQSSFSLVDGVVPTTNLTEGISGSDISQYRSNPAAVLQAIEFATSLALVSWGLLDLANFSGPSNLIRRAIPQGRIQYLAPNSTLGSIQLPYFKVEKFEYITDPESTLTSQQWALLNDTSPYNPFLQSRGYAAIFPNAWGPGSSPTLPPPIKVLESRILGILVDNPSIPRCGSPPSSSVPQGIRPYLTSITNSNVYSCFIFANVTYTAGGAICRNCKIVSQSVVQDHIANLQPIPDALTIEALALTPIVSTHMSFNAYMNTGTTDSFTFQAFAIEFVSRAYQSAWSSLAVNLGEIGQDSQTSVMVAIPATQPSVVLWRVYLWATLHLAVLLGGIAFVHFQSPSSHTWASDHVTEAFLLDTTRIFEQVEAAHSDEKNPWHPDAAYPAGKLKLNDYDPSRPGKPRSVVLIPTRSPPHSS